MIKNTFLWSFFAIGVIGISIFFFVKNSPTPPAPQAHDPQKKVVETPLITHVNLAGKSIQVDLALTSAEREQGLSGRAYLPENKGLLFVFDNPGTYQFWMKDMNFPIDIIWINEDLHVVYIKKNAQPELYPETYGPIATDRDAKYVLEVPSGFSEKNKLKIGDEVKMY